LPTAAALQVEIREKLRLHSLPALLRSKNTSLLSLSARALTNPTIRNRFYLMGTIVTMANNDPIIAYVLFVNHHVSSISALVPPYPAA
jgi:hypothetical protein